MIPLNTAAMLEKIFKVKSLAKIIIPAFLSVFISLLILSLAPNYFLVIVIVLVPFFIIIVLNKPFVLLQILILILPFTNMPFLDDQPIMGISGLKVINILVFFIFVSFVLKKLTININFYEKLFIVGMLSILLIAVIRSIPQIPMINLVMDENFSHFRFIQSFFLKPIIYFSIFIFISLYVSDIEKIELLFKTFIFSIFIFSVVLLAIYVFLTPDKTNFENIRDSFSSVIHLHGNGIASIYLISFPLIMSYFYMKKNVFSILSIILCLITIGLLYSRTAYALVLISIFMYLFFSKRLGWTPIVFCFLLFSFNFLPSSITERALTGIESNDTSQISAGRVSEIWVPLINEVMESPKKLFIGSGIRAMMFSDAHRDGHILQTGHAHNLYLNTILEIGLLGLAFFALFYVIFIKNIFKTLNKTSIDNNGNEILIGVVVSSLCFFIAGITGRQLFPNMSNYSLWIILAIGSAILKIQGKKGTV